MTVRTRAARLIEDGGYLRSGRCGKASRTRWRWWRSLASPDLVGEGEVFSTCGAWFLAVLTGRHDLILTVLLNEEFGLLDFYTNEFSKCHDRVSSIETFIVYKGFSLEGASIFWKRARRSAEFFESAGVLSAFWRRTGGAGFRTKQGLLNGVIHVASNGITRNA